LGSLHGAGGGQRGGRGTTAQEEEAVEPPARVREGGRGRGPVCRLGLLGHSGPKGWMGQLAIGPKVEGKPFRNKNWIFKYTRALKICTRRFRRKFDMEVFPKFF
jgi:hypothetical protein